MSTAGTVFSLDVVRMQRTLQVLPVRVVMERSAESSAGGGRRRRRNQRSAVCQRGGLNSNFQKD